MSSKNRLFVLLVSVLIAVALFFGIRPIQNRITNRTEALKTQQAQQKSEKQNAPIETPEKSDNDIPDDSTPAVDWNNYGFNNARANNDEWMCITAYDFTANKVYFDPASIQQDSWYYCGRIFSVGNCTFDNWTADYRLDGTNKSNTVSINNYASSNSCISIGSGGSYNISHRVIDATNGYVAIEVLYNVSINSQPVKLTFIPSFMVDMSKAPVKTEKGFEFNLISESQRAK